MSTNTTTLIAELRQLGVHGVDQYEQRLLDNASNPEVEGDLLFEGRAALAFARHGFKVTLRESPDLQLELNGEVLFAEVKHFREKEQDLLDEKAMLETEDVLVPYGDTIPTEGKSPWTQIVDVAIKKACQDQYVLGAPNILVIENSSPALELTLSTAIEDYDAEVVRSKDKRLRRLNTIVLVHTYGITFGSSGLYNIEIAHTADVETQMSPELLTVLNDIRIA
jgi:hypothetical protein